MNCQVYIERALQQNDAGIEGLAKAMAEQFGISQIDVERKIRKGRFRVKSNVKIAKAKAFVNALENSGAVCSIISGNGSVLYKTAHVEQKTPPNAGSTTSGHKGNTAQHSLEPVPLDEGKRAFGALESVGEASLGSLGANPSGNSFLPSNSAMAPLPTPENQFAQKSEDDFDLLTNPGMMLSGVDGSAIEDELSEEEFGAVLQSEDSFLPPEAKRKEELVLDREGSGISPLPIPESPIQNKGNLATSEELKPVREEPSSRASTDGSQEKNVVQNGGTEEGLTDAKSSSLGEQGFLNNPIKRRILGTILVLSITFLPAYFWAKQKEEHAFQKISNEITETQNNVKNQQGWENLDSFRSEKSDELKFIRTNSAFTLFVLWSVLAGALGFVFLTKVNWDKVFGKESERKISS